MVQDVDNQIEALGLDPGVIANHRHKLFQAEADSSQFLPIIDTCRLDNGGLIPLPEDQTPGSPQVVAFVPAAGAASRYFKPLADLLLSLEGQQWNDAFKALQNLVSDGALQWPLPPTMKEVLSKFTTFSPADLSAYQQKLIAEIHRPKALQPCVTDGVSFLAMKTKEHDALKDFLSAQVFVCPMGQSRDFSDSLQKLAPQLSAVTTEQGPDLSTLRFRHDGVPYQDEEGQISMVPAGHGALARKFAELKQQHPHWDGLFIRNVDNVMGLNLEALAASRQFLSLFQRCLTAMQTIRSGKVSAQAIAELEQLLPNLPTVTNEEERLWRLQKDLFHYPAPRPVSRNDLLALFQRPLNILGQVPNTNADVGGTPCFVKVRGAATKICLEVPHASPQDKEDFLANPVKATHFNPVFAACELVADRDYYHPPNNPFWLKAHKTFRGEDVVYHETVLYELVGNSQMSNVLFVEVPRCVFNPHKTLADGASQTAQKWLPTP